MKKLFLLTLFMCSLYSQGQTIQGYSYSTSVSAQAAGALPGINIINSGSAFHKLVWTISGGTFSACQIQIDTSSDGSSWTGAGALASQLCTGNGNAISSSVIPNYIRINITTLTVGTGSPFLNAVAYGYVNNPSTGSGSVTSCGPGNAVYTANGTTVTCDPLITDSSLNGTLNFAQGSIAASAAWLNHTATWNNSAIAFTDIFSNLTCTLSLAASKIIDLQVAGASIFQIRFANGNCTTPQMQIPDGSNASPGIFFATDGTGNGVYRNGANDWAWTNGTNPFFRAKINSGTEIANNGCYGVSSTSSAVGTMDLGLDRSAAGVFRFDANSACNDGLGVAQAAKYNTTANCASSGGTCAAASSGSVSIAAAATTVTVATTAVTANSVIVLTEDSTLGTKLTVTCNTTTGRTYTVTTRTAGTSFVITASAAPVTNPACLNYLILN